MMSYQVRIFCVLLFVFLTPFFSFSKRELKGTEKSPLCVLLSEFSTIKKIISHFGLSQKQVGYIVYDCQKKRIVLKKNKDRLYIPGSTTKLLTTIAALDILGSSYRFKTALGYTGKIVKGVLGGDLYLKGYGDPILSTTDLLNIVEAMKRVGIKKVAGTFYYDQSVLINRPFINHIGDMNSSINTGVSALSLHHNYITVNWESSTNSTDFDIYATPSVPMYKFYLSRSSGLHGFHYKVIKGKESWVVSRKYLQNNRSRRLPIRKSALFVALMFKKFAALNGVAISAISEGVMPSFHKLIYLHKSRKLLYIIKRILQESNSMMSELVLLVAAKKLTGKKLSLLDASTALLKWYKKKIPTVDWSGMILKNGSGLNSKHRITPRQLSKIINFGCRKLYLGHSFLSLLPVSGWRGTLAARIKHPTTAFRVWAKTGTLFYSSAIAGYLYPRSGKKMLFVLFISDIKKRKIIDSRNDSRSGPLLKQVFQWKKRAFTVQDLILTKWILQL